MSGGSRIARMSWPACMAINYQLVWIGAPKDEPQRRDGSLPIRTLAVNSPVPRRFEGWVEWGLWRHVCATPMTVPQVRVTRGGRTIWLPDLPGKRVQGRMDQTDVADAYRLYATAIWRRCRLILRDEATARDVTQEVFARCFRHHPK